MKAVATGNPEKLSFREPCGWGVLFRLPALLLPAALAWHLVGSRVAEGVHSLPALVVAIAGGFALLLLLKTASLVARWFGRVGVTFDRVNDTVTPKWGLLFPVPVGEHPLDRFAALVLDRRRSGYELALTGPGTRVLVGRGRKYAPLRAMAEDAGAFLGLDVIDADGPEAVLLPAESLGRSLAQQVTSATRVEMPARCRSKLRVKGDHVVLTLPRRRPLPGPRTFGILLLGLFGLAAVRYLDAGADAALSAGATGGGALVVAVTSFALLAGGRVILDADPHRLRVVRRWGVFSRKRDLAADRIREIRVGPAGIEVFTTRERVAFGRGLSGAEAEWVRALLTRAITGGKNT